MKIVKHREVSITWKWVQSQSWDWHWGILIPGWIFVLTTEPHCYLWDGASGRNTDRSDMDGEHGDRRGHLPSQPGQPEPGGPSLQSSRRDAFSASWVQPLGRMLLPECLLCFQATQKIWLVRHHWRGTQDSSHQPQLEEMQYLFCTKAKMFLIYLYWLQ